MDAANAERVAEVCSKVRIERSADEVYRFITTPGNWIGTHPVTLAVTGTSGAPQGLGSSWTEIIRSHAGRFPAVWTVVDARPPRSWTIRTEGFWHTSATVTIEYVLTADGTATIVERKMSVFRPKGPLNLILGPIFARKRMHEEFLGAVKACLERSQP